MNKTRTIKSASGYITLTSSSTKNINRIPYPLISYIHDGNTCVGTTTGTDHNISPNILIRIP